MMVYVCTTCIQSEVILLARVHRYTKAFMLHLTGFDVYYHSCKYILVNKIIIVLILVAVTALLGWQPFRDPLVNGDQGSPPEGRGLGRF
jgi:hypothetical protein